MATSSRCASWRYDVDSCRCRVCTVDGSHEDLRHLLLDCSFAKLCDIRRKYIVAYTFVEENENLCTFLKNNFQLCGGRLRCLFGAGGDDDEVAAATAFGFVRGFWSDALITAIRRLAPEGVDSLRGLLVWCDLLLALRGLIGILFWMCGTLWQFRRRLLSRRRRRRRQLSS